MAKSTTNRTQKPIKKTRRSFIKKALGFVVVLCLVRGCTSQGNALKILGFRVDNGSILFNAEPDNLKGAEMFVKASLTMPQAKALLKEFKQQKPSGVYFDNKPGDMPMLEDNAEWQPRSVKKYWCGSFSKMDDLKSLYHCKYVFDVSQPNNVTLYVYGITSDD